MGTSLSRLNNKLSFDFDTYIQERDELARDLRGLATDAAWHRRVKGSWQMFSGASGVAAGIAGGVALATAPITFGLSLPAVATTAMLVGNSITAASLASSAASYGYEHVVDKDIAKRLMNMRHVIFSIALKDKEVCVLMVKRKYVAATNEKNQKSFVTNAAAPTSTVSKLQLSDVENKFSSRTDSPKKEKRAVEKESSTVTTSKMGDDDVSSIANTPDPPQSREQQSQPIQACQQLCEVWDSWDLANKENKQVGFDLAVALVRSTGVVLGTNSILQGNKTVNEAHDLETALLKTAEALEKETSHIRMLDLRYCSCIPYERKLPRGRLQHIDGGGGQVDMLVSFDHFGVREMLHSDSTQTIRLPEHATNVKVSFRDRAGKLVKKVDRSSPKQDWVKDATGKPELEECELSVADGADVIFVVKGALTHAFIHKAWDFGRRGKPRPWEWWENAAEECKELIPDIEKRLAYRSKSDGQSTSQGGVALCCFAG